jgi:excisionase family DNA binding protein
MERKIYLEDRINSIESKLDELIDLIANGKTTVFDNKAYTVKETAEILLMSNSTLYKKMRERKISYIRDGGISFTGTHLKM